MKKALNMKNELIVLAHIVNPQTDKKCNLIKNGALHLKYNETKKSYLIKDIGTKSSIIKKMKSDIQILDYSEQVIIPSFFDMHFHWVQDDVREMPKANLLNWLDNYTFPSERKFENKKYSKEKASHFFKRLSSVGTLGGACYSSIHEHTLDHAMKETVGDFIIGNVLMTINSPDYLKQTSKKAISLVEKFTKKYQSKYALTPRFAIATDPVTMKATAKIAKKNKGYMQSHLCETHNEIEFVTSLYRGMSGFEKIKSYTEIYKKVGMLGPKSIMGHGIHLQGEEIKMLAKTNTAIAHCPTSNAPIKEKGLGSGLFDFHKIEKNKIRWALGSDIGGGPVLSMFDVIRSFVDQNEKAKVKGATHIKGLYRATLAGAKLLNVDKKTGNLDIGKEANFLVLPKLKNTELKSSEEVIKYYVDAHRKKRIKYDQMLDKVFYQGNLIYSKDKL